MGVTPSPHALWMKAAAPTPRTGVCAARAIDSQNDVCPSASGGMVLELGGVRLHACEDFDAALLRRVVSSLHLALSRRESSGQAG